MRIDQAERILDAAAELYARHGVHGVGMGEVARAAGYSRATLYRYYKDRRSLHIAFAQREAQRIGALVLAEAEDLADAVLAAVRHVREAPQLVAWFGAADAATTAEFAQSDEVIEALGLPAIGDRDTARWLVRVIVSLLIVPGRDEAEERAIVERFVVPGLSARS